MKEYEEPKMEIDELTDEIYTEGTGEVLGPSEEGGFYRRAN